jgi:pyruvate/2-oxoglutarate dehydrogenase complex dihydrolipoamide acyltransferase (E2) component
MSSDQFFAALAQQIDVARDGKDQADESTTVTVSNIGKAGMKIGIPAIVAPAVATLAIGQTYPLPVPDGAGFKFRPTVMATLSFDHRIANGVGAANFLNEVKQAIEGFRV